MSGFNGQVEADVLHHSDVVNDLTRQDTDKPAAQKEVYDLNLSKLSAVVGGISNNSSLTHESGDGVHLIILSRVDSNRAVIAVTDYWSSGYIVLGGSVPSGITISKAANTHTYTITNNTGSAIAYTLS